MQADSKELSLSEIVDLIQCSQQELEKSGSDIRPIRDILEIEGTCDVTTTNWDRALFQVLMKRFDTLETYVKQNQLLLLQLARKVEHI